MGMKKKDNIIKVTKPKMKVTSLKIKEKGKLHKEWKKEKEFSASAHWPSSFFLNSHPFLPPFYTLHRKTKQTHQNFVFDNKKDPWLTHESLLKTH